MLRQLVNDVLSETYYQMAFHPENYADADLAAKEFIRINTSVAQTKTIDMHTVIMFLKNVYKGGDHGVGVKELVKALRNLGITVVDNRKEKIADFEKFVKR